MRHIKCDNKHPLSKVSKIVETHYSALGSGCEPGRRAWVSLAQERLRKRADLCDLRFHDLRHEAISRFFEMELSVPEVAVISGHKDARMLFRFTHLRAENIIVKLG